MTTLAYAANFTPDDDGRYVVTFPDFGWGATDGATMEEAIFEAEDCLAEIIASTISDGEDLPEASAPVKGQVLIYPPAEIAAKAMLYITVKKMKFKTIDLARGLHVDEKEARRILNPHHKTKLPRLEQALRVVGKRMVLSFEDEDDTQKNVCA
jgi:antitoxin HicB